VYQGMANDYLMNPSGGNPIHEDAMQSWGMIGADLGLSFFGQPIVNWMAKVNRARVLGAPYRMSKRKLIDMYGDAKLKSGNNLAHLASDKKGSLGAAKVATLRRKGIKGALTESRALKASYASWGKTVKRLGVFTAALGLADVAFSIFAAATTPGVSRETLERDRHRIYSDEGMLDTRLAYTQRQRAIQAIHDSQLSVGRAMLGQEASYLHR